MPDGSVQAISTAAATILSLGLAFVGLWAWGPQSSRAWEWRDLWVLLFMVIAFPCLGLVPWFATQSDGLACARKLYLAGNAALFLGVVSALIISFTYKKPT